MTADSSFLHYVFLQPRKFKPTIPQKKKKSAEDRAAVKSEPGEEDAFKDLVLAVSPLALLY